MHGRQVFVEIAEVIFAELAGGITLGFERGREGTSLRRDADLGAGLADGREAGAQRNFTGDEGRPAGGATCFSVVIGKDHSFRGELVEIGRLPRHHSAVVGANVEPTNIVSHDADDIWLLSGARGRRLTGLLGLRRTSVAS